MRKFRNIIYNYRNADDSFDAKGLHLNMIVDELNRTTVSVEVEIPNTGGDVIIGPMRSIRGARVNYTITRKGATPQYQAGEITIINNDTINPEWKRASVGDDVAPSGILLSVVVEPAQVNVGDIILRITNTTGDEVLFTYRINISEQ